MSPLKERADQVVERIVESGLVHYWFEESIRIAAQVNISFMRMIS